MVPYLLALVVSVVCATPITAPSNHSHTPPASFSSVDFSHTFEPMEATDSIRRRERNNLAAKKCRQKRKQRNEVLARQAEELSTQNAILHHENETLRSLLKAELHDPSLKTSLKTQLHDPPFEVMNSNQLQEAPMDVIMLGALPAVDFMPHPALATTMDGMPQLATTTDNILADLPTDISFNDLFDVHFSNKDDLSSPSAHENTRTHKRAKHDSSHDFAPALLATSLTAAAVVAAMVSEDSDDDSSRTINSDSGYSSSNSPSAEAFPNISMYHIRDEVDLTFLDFNDDAIAGIDINALLLTDSLRWT